MVRRYVRCTVYSSPYIGTCTHRDASVHAFFFDLCHVKCKMLRVNTVISWRRTHSKSLTQTQSSDEILKITEICKC